MKCSCDDYFKKRLGCLFCENTLEGKCEPIFFLAKTSFFIPDNTIETLNVGHQLPDKFYHFSKK